MDEFITSGGENTDIICCFQYDEKLEAEYIMRVRSIFDEFVCPQTGTIFICTFTELLQGIARFWSLAQEMKSFTQEIPENTINLPLLLVLVLLRLVEKEYTLEDHEKTPADPQLEESLLKLFLDIHSKVAHFKKPRAQKVLLNTALMFLRHLLTILGADRRIKRIKWGELSVKSLKIECPIRKTDMKIILASLRHFREEILPKYSKNSIPFNLIFANRYPEIMEPTREIQSEISNFLFTMSGWMVIFSILMLGTTGIFDVANSPGGFSVYLPKFNSVPNVNNNVPESPVIVESPTPAPDSAQVEPEKGKLVNYFEQLQNKAKEIPKPPNSAASQDKTKKKKGKKRKDK